MRTQNKNLTKTLHRTSTFAEAKLVIESDGDPHGTPDQVIHNGRRDSFLRAQDLSVLRFWNFQVAEEFDAVLETICRALERQPLTRALSPRGERDELPESASMSRSSSCGEEDEEEEKS